MTYADLTDAQLTAAQDRLQRRLEEPLPTLERDALRAALEGLMAERAWRERAAAATAFETERRARAGAVTCPVSRRISHGPPPR